MDNIVRPIAISAIGYAFSFIILHGFFGNYSMDEGFPIYDLVYVSVLVLLGLFLVGVVLSIMLVLTVEVIGGKSSTSFIFCGLIGTIYSYSLLIFMMGNWFIMPSFSLSDIPFPVSGAILGVLMALSRQFPNQ